MRNCVALLVFHLFIMKLTNAREVFAGILLVWTGVDAVADLRDNPYQAISARNAFALRAIPKDEPKEPPQVPTAPSLEIKLTGVATFPGSSSCAILEFFHPQTKRTDRPPPFREGERYDEHIQVVGIDAARGVVHVSQDGLVMALDFERNGIKEGSTALPIAPPRVPTANMPQPIPPGRGIHGAKSDAPPTVAPAMTRPEAEARIAAHRLLFQQQNPSAARIFPPPRP